MKKIIYILPLLLLLSACNPFHKHAGAETENKDFEKFKSDFIDRLWQTYPGWATSQGYHNYDSVLVIPDEAERKKELDFAQWISDKLKAFDPQSLTANEKTDYALIQGQADAIRFNINDFKSYEWDPSGYNMGESIFDIMDYKKMSLDERLQNISKKLANVPAYFEAAKHNIHHPTREHTELAIKQNRGSLYFFNSTFPDSLKNSHLSDADVQTFNTRAAAAKKAIEDYASWLETEVLAKDSSKLRSFRIGTDLYAKKFKLDIDSRYTSTEMYQKALARKDYLHQDMKRLCDELWPKYFAGMKTPGDTLLEINLMVGKLSLQHCDRDSFLQTVEQQLPELIAFINSHNIIDLDSTKPLKVRKTPEYAAGVAGAGINSPGPYDSSAATYYNVTPLTRYSDEDAESYLREYNHYVLQILNIHEAIPGHYTQLIYANRSPDIIKSVLGNGAMIEGWACYVERMMIEQGYNTSPEMQLSYDKWNLREVCNFLLDYNIHCNNWSQDQVMDLLVRQAFQQNAEAKEKWKRATLSQVQLASYFSGQTEIFELREEMNQKQGSNFDLKKFHEQFLSYGSAPVKEIRALMAGE
jgi:uncharacterized protein (DUF885 family)